jgi:hypothetical protein
MKQASRNLLVLDGVINLALGGLLLALPLGLASFFGVPESPTYFYAAILGGVLFGIGIALLIEAYGRERGFRGLGLEGAIAVNFCGALVLAVWLVAVPLHIPLRGQVLLWAIVGTVFLVGAVEIVHRRSTRRPH